MESYARKADAKGRSTDFIFSEASRKPEASIHVANPLPPVIVFGVGVEDVQEMHDSAVAAATITVRSGHVRKVALDKKTLHTVVASYPGKISEVLADPAKQRAAEQWESRTVAWLRQQYGDDLKSVIRHQDEEYFHVHAFVVPTSDPAMAALKYHPGTTAKREIMAGGPAEGEDAKALSRRADAAYKLAMRTWQDSYHEVVAVPCGLTRLGPQRRRLSREEWQREQAQAKALQQTIERAKQVRASGESFMKKTKAEAAAILSAAQEEREAAARALNAAEASESEAREARETAKEAAAHAKRYYAVGGRLRALWDSLSGSALAKKIRLEFSAEIERVQAFAKSVQARLKEEEKRRREAERKAHDASQDAERARNAALRMQIERDRAFSMLPPEQLQQVATLTPTLQPRLRPTSATTRK